mmetsp:Transcript_16501/g.23457  ORF Transcript_16501/g.23457 Transcript_16501/m.23457 type:complete len:88 (-) Transcript_16501:563-826(-)
MKVTVDATRIMHLIILVALTILGGKILIERWNWSRLSAYSFTCSLVCQISNAILKIFSSDLNQNDTASSTKLAKKGRKGKKRNNLIQ